MIKTIEDIKFGLDMSVITDIKESRRLHMNVADTISIMIKAYPSLYSSYTDALYRIASGYSTQWDTDGNVVIYYSEYPEMSLEFKDSNLLNNKLEHARQVCIIENIDLVIAEKDSFSNQVPGDSLKFLEKPIPENANQEWIDAFLELIDNIIWYQFPKGKFEGMAESYETSYRSRLQEAISSAKKCKINLIGTDTEKTEQMKQTYMKAINDIIINASNYGIILEVKDVT